MGSEPDLDAIDDISEQTVYCPVPSCDVNYSGPKALKRLSAHKRSHKTEVERKHFGPTTHERRFLKKNLDTQIKQELWFLMAKYSLTGPCVEDIVDFTSQIWNSANALGLKDFSFIPKSSRTIVRSLQDDPVTIHTYDILLTEKNKVFSETFQHLDIREQIKVFSNLAFYVIIL